MQDSTGTALSPYSVMKERIDTVVKSFSLADENARRNFRNAMLMVTKANLGNCTVKSVITAALNIAHLGLNPSPILEQVAVIPFKNSRMSAKLGRRVDDATVVIMYKGKLSLSLRSGVVKSVRAIPVYDNDEWTYYEDENGPHYKLVPWHEKGKDASGELKKVLFTAQLSSGANMISVHPVSELLKRIPTHAKEKKDHPWNTHRDAMLMKSALHAGMKTIPLSPEMSAADYLDRLADEGVPQPAAFNDEIGDEIENAEYTEVETNEAKEPEAPFRATPGETSETVAEKPKPSESERIERAIIECIKIAPATPKQIRAYVASELKIDMSEKYAEGMLDIVLSKHDESDAIEAADGQWFYYWGELPEGFIDDNPEEEQASSSKTTDEESEKPKAPPKTESGKRPGLTEKRLIEFMLADGGVHKAIDWCDLLSESGYRATMKSVAVKFMTLSQSGAIVKEEVGEEVFYRHPEVKKIAGDNTESENASTGEDIKPDSNATGKTGTTEPLEEKPATAPENKPKEFGPEVPKTERKARDETTKPSDPLKTELAKQVSLSMELSRKLCERPGRPLDDYFLLCFDKRAELTEEPTKKLVSETLNHMLKEGFAVTVKPDDRPDVLWYPSSKLLTWAKNSGIKVGAMPSMESLDLGEKPTTPPVPPKHDSSGTQTMDL